MAAFRDAQGRSIFIGRFGNADKGSDRRARRLERGLRGDEGIRTRNGATFRFNVYVTNLFNQANWGRPDTNVTSANYGRITSLNSGLPAAAVVVLGGRVTF